MRLCIIENFMLPLHCQKIKSNLLMKISWTDETWNPVTGCTPISAACKYCYAKAMIPFLQKEHPDKYRNGFDVTAHPKSLNEPAHWDTPRLVFICSMSDLFHEDVPFEFIDKIMFVIKSTPHTYQVLTKRPKRMAEYFAEKPVLPNLWLGVTVEDNSVKDRIDTLRNLNAPIRFLSCEPLLENLVELDLRGIHWVIVGGEHGLGENPALARPMKKEWVLSVKEQTEKQGALFYFKQWGSWGSDGIPRSVEDNGCELDGKIYQPRPEKERRPTLFG